MPTLPAVQNLSLVRGLGPIAATAIVVAGVIGTGVFLKSRVMTCNVELPWLVMAVWIVAGLLAMAGALTYGELSAMMPRAGGEYVLIREAYGRLAGFLFGWMRFFIGNTGGIAALAFGLGIFLNVLLGGALSAWSVDLHLAWSHVNVDGIKTVAIAAILVATVINCAAVSVGGTVASILMVLKVIFVLGIGTVALLFGQGDWAHLTMSGAAGACEGVPADARGGMAGAGAAMMAAMWAYNGWNELTYVAGEVRDPGRTLPRGLIGGLSIVAFLYVFVNATYFYVLTPTAVASVAVGSTVATEVVTHIFGQVASSLLAGVFAVSVFSSLQVTSMVTARVPYAMAQEGLFFAPLSRLSPRTKVPIRALVAQAAWASVLVLSGSFDTLTDYAMFAILGFVGMATASVFVFRRRWPDVERPYRTWGYPVVPLLALGVTTWLLVNTLVTAPRQALAGLVLIALGLPFYWYWSRAAEESRRV
ncbi:MAG: amino acid permease [Vicinamibacteria bacterium]|nr:amino acid permease [Vicinamibacteria bacterium]